MPSSLISRLILAAIALSPVLHAQTPAATAYRYLRVGNTADIAATPHPGYALMGGGTDLDEAFQWLCDRAGGGDLLVVRARGGDDYNPYIQKLCKLNSVATLILPSREAAMDPFAERTIAHASAIFIAGGDQANYINFWMGTPVQTAINDAIKRGVPIGGTSAGLAVMGEYAYSAQGDKPDDRDLDSSTVLADPFHPRVTLVHGFLYIPILKGIITDSHFAKRDRMGRLLVFLARVQMTGVPQGISRFDGSGIQNIRGIGVQERAAVLVEPTGEARVVGQGPAYFIDATKAARQLQRDSHQNMGSDFGPYTVQKVSPGHSFNLKTWLGDSARYDLTVQATFIQSTQPNGSVY